MKLCFFSRRLGGSLGISLITGITAITMAGVAIQMGFANYKLKTEKQLHILNSIRFATIVQIGLEEGWLSAPASNTSASITLTQVDLGYNFSSNLKDPSNDSTTYKTSSYILVNNDNGTLKFYASLIQDNSEHIYVASSTEVHLLSISDITLNI
jgi:hypothetical protein